MYPAEGISFSGSVVGFSDVASSRSFAIQEDPLSCNICPLFAAGGRVPAPEGGIATHLVPFQPRAFGEAAVPVITSPASRPILLFPQEINGNLLRLVSIKSLILSYFHPSGSVASYIIISPSAGDEPEVMGETNTGSDPTGGEIIVSSLFLGFVMKK